MADPSLLTFNQLLESAGLVPTEVRLLRHRAQRPAQQRRMRDAAVARSLDFQRYQERQVALNVIEQFRAAKYLAGSIAEPMTKQTVFAGVWQRLEERSVHIGDPISDDPDVNRPGLVEFNTVRVPSFDAYIGRLVVDWGDGTRAWVQRADNQNKAVIELRPRISDPDYPGHLQLQVPLSEVEALYSSWVQVLRNARGVYLLVHRERGDQYVGSAYGADGFYGRWCAYVNGHGGNVAMKELGESASAFDATILEIAGSDATVEDIVARESLWKTKLGTRVSGLNLN